ncbi:chemotaxis-specific protein-glutamate methyltransferase CheB [Rhizorhapis suberifaciens]|uniref:Protein-glutamate methylesterase/protein-glutamine glutaminase n=1 Tax=Rhizorhapis suberifaciens TaxID=13656 RepID=A0A840HWV9_9SPHN|nr:chemotaxis-specific protein-glutamate methyltransferase CheB [Rhizorhapis suberifaciens]MBB4642141.1 two-component system chemotaxis response regulator CheB [Rhizorhapis suberifaciens]
MSTRVLVVDDSITMRALFTDVLERTSGINVVGAAANADEARDMISELKPDVLTLDVEMPGKSGLEFLEELMESNPMPVVMLSTLTQKGAQTSFKALELGAVDCFPKPQQATPAEFDKIVDKLGKLVIAAASGKVKAKAVKEAAPVASISERAYKWNGALVAMSASTGGVEAIAELLASFPPNCPPTIVLQQMEAGFAEPFTAKLNEKIKPNVVVASDGLKLEQGTVYIVADPAKHAVIDRWPDASIRLLGNDPVQGFRPSADLLFATIAKTAGTNAVGMILTGMGRDGANGLKALRGAGGKTFAQDKDSCMVYEAPAAAVAQGAVGQQLPLDGLAAAALSAAGTLAKAA